MKHGGLVGKCMENKTSGSCAIKCKNKHTVDLRGEELSLVSSWRRFPDTAAGKMSAGSSTGPTELLCTESGHDWRNSVNNSAIWARVNFIAYCLMMAFSKALVSCVQT
jgi:hypothetical protein